MGDKSNSFVQSWESQIGNAQVTGELSVAWREQVDLLEGELGLRIDWDSNLSAATYYGWTLNE